MKILNLFSFLLVLALCILTLWESGLLSSKVKQKKGSVLEDSDNKMGIQNTLLWVFIIYFFVMMRFAGITSIPGGVNQDGAMAAVEANSLAHYLTDRFGTWIPAHLKGWGYSQMNAAMSYFMVPFMWVFGLNKLSMRLPMLLMSLLGATAVVVLIRRAFSERTAMIAALFLAINPWQFMQSRWALESNFFPHVFAIGLCFLVLGIKKKKYLYISMVFFALSMYCYGVSFYMVPFFLIANSLFFLRNKKINLKELGTCVLIYFGVSWPIYLTMFINFMKWNTISLPFVTIEYFEGSIRSRDILFFSENVAEQFGNNLRSTINIVFLQKQDLPWNGIPLFGTMYLCSLPLVLVGLFLVIREVVYGNNIQKKLFSFIMASYWCFSVLLGVFINNVNVNRINIVIYANVILAVIGISFLISKIRYCSVALLVIYALQSTMFFNTYFSTWADEIEDIFYCDFLEALDNVEKYHADHYMITPDTQYEGSWNVSEILVLFEYDIDAAYFRGDKKEWDGKEIPYGERFRYARVEEGEMPSKDIVYVINTSKVNQFPQELFLVEQFGTYATATPWEIVWQSWENENG